jgi:hypothetical protein
MFSDARGNFTGQVTGPRYAGGKQAGYGRIRPMEMLTHRRSPSADCSSQLLKHGKRLQGHIPLFHQRAANVNRVHRFISPGPDKRAAKDLSRFIRHLQRAKAAIQNVFTVCDRYYLFSFERKQKQLRHFLDRLASVLAVPTAQLALEFLVDFTHGAVRFAKSKFLDFAATSKIIACEDRGMKKRGSNLTIRQFFAVYKWVVSGF